MRALSTLEDSVEDFDSLIIRTVDNIVTERIARSIGLLDVEDPTPVPGVHTISGNPFKAGIHVAEGLSSEEFDDEDEGADDNDSGLVNHVPAVSLEQILKDNEVKDPEKEAVSGDNEEATFDELFGPTTPPVLTYTDTKPTRPYAKKLPKNNKAKVSTFEGVEE